MVSFLVKRLGTGLGLYLSKKLAKEMGGNITVKSEYQKGSRFSLLLPARPQEGEEPAGGENSVPGSVAGYYK